MTRRRRTLPAGAVAVPWAVWAALRAGGAERGFPLVPAMAFTPYAAATALLPVAVAAAGRSRTATAVSAGSAAVLAGAVLGRARPRPRSTARPGGRVLRLGTVNLWLGRADPAAVVALAGEHDLDVLALQEVTPEAAAGLRTAGIERLLPHGHVVHARPGNPPGAGGAVWTRLPVTARTVTPGRFDQPTVRLAVPGAPDLEVTAVHCQPPARSPRDVARWTADLAALPDPGPDCLRVLAGDFNATLDHAALRRLLRRGWTDAARAAGRALTSTWGPVRSPHPRLVLDHVLVSDAVGVLGVDVVPMRGTDHRAVVARLALPGAGPAGVPEA